MSDIKKFAEQLVELTLKETTELIEYLQDEFGINLYITSHNGQPSEKEHWESILTLPLIDTNLSIRTLNVLKALNVTTTQELAKYIAKEPGKLKNKFIRYRNCGKRTYKEILEFINKYKLIKEI